MGTFRSILRRSVIGNIPEYIEKVSYWEHSRVFEEGQLYGTFRSIVRRSLIGNIPEYIEKISYWEHSGVY